jgi:hypothetical protein
MAFIRKKVNGKHFAQVVENYREDAKVKQRVLLHLGEYLGRGRRLVYSSTRGGVLLDKHTNLLSSTRAKTTRKTGESQVVG